MKNKSYFFTLKMLIIFCFFAMLIMSILSCSRIKSYLSGKHLANTTWQEENKKATIKFGDPSFHLEFENMMGSTTIRTGVFSIEGDSIFLVESKGGSMMGTIIGDILTIEIGHSRVKFYQIK